MINYIFFLCNRRIEFNPLGFWSCELTSTASTPEQPHAAVIVILIIVVIAIDDVYR